MRPLFLAFRRGLLKEGYRWGLASRLREALVIDMLLMEEAAESKLKSIQVSSTMLGPNVDRKKYEEVMENYYNALDIANNLRQYNLYAEKERIRREKGIFRRLVKDFRRMKKDGTIAAFEKAVEEKYKELGIEK